MTRVRTVGQETIDQQSDAFKKALMIKLEDYINLSEKDLLDTAESKDLADIIKSFTGMSVHVQFSKLATHMVPLDVKANNILINKAVRKWFTNSVGMAAINAGKGTTSILVDLEKGKITGALIEYRFTLNIGTEVMNGKFTTGELAAIILHEVGHAFTYLEYIVRAITTNQVMEGVAKELAGTNDIKKREAILVSAKQALRLKDLDAASLAACEDNKVVEYTLISSTITEPDSQSGSSIYDENSFEMLADQYAARNGAGRDLVTALDKLHKSRQVKYISYRSTGEYLFVEALKVVMLVVGMANPVSLSGVIFKSLSWWGFMFMLAADSHTTIYDRPERRLTRIRQQVLDRLKNYKGAISKEEEDNLLEDLKVIDKITEDVKDKRQLLSYLGALFSRAHRERYKQEQLQKELESLVYNDLFKLSVELKREAK